MGAGEGDLKKKKKEKTRFSKIFQSSGGFLRVSFHKETLACNLATATTTKVLVAHIPDKQRNV